MIVKQYLSEYRTLRRKLAEYDERVALMSAQCEKLTARLDGQPHGKGGGGPNDKALAALADLRKERDDLARSCQAAYCAADALIGELERESFRRVLRAVYLSAESERDLPALFHKSESWVRYTRREALRTAQELYDRKFPEPDAGE